MGGGGVPYLEEEILLGWVGTSDFRVEKSHFGVEKPHFWGARSL